MSNKNNSPEQKAEWRSLQERKQRPQTLPRDAVAFWTWGKVGMFREVKTRGAFGTPKPPRKTVGAFELRAYRRITITKKGEFVRA